MQGCNDVDEHVAANGRQEPYIVATETDDTMEFYIYIESEFLLSVGSLGDALANLICTYFVFNIAYPKEMYAMLIFLQHFVLAIKDSQKVPTAVSALCSSLSVHNS